VDTCAEAWSQAAEPVGKIYARMKDTDGWDLVQKTISFYKEKYGESYCPFEAGAKAVIGPAGGGSEISTGQGGGGSETTTGQGPTMPTAINPAGLADTSCMHAMPGFLFFVAVLAMDMTNNVVT